MDQASQNRTSSQPANSRFKSQESEKHYTAGAVKGGQIQGGKNRDNGHWAKVSQMVDRVAAAKKAGKIAVETGQVYTISTPESCSQGGKTQGNREVENGHFAKIRPKGLHTRWHVTGTTTKSGTWVEPKPNPKCSFCIAEGLITYV
jgi:hypothetical protein